MNPPKLNHVAGSVLVTGASGFVGSGVVQRLAADGRRVAGAVRRPQIMHPLWVSGPTLAADADWRPLLDGTDVVVHTAARVHMMNEDAASAHDAHMLTNTQGTLALATQAATAGVKRFVFISTIKVMGESSVRPFRASDIPAPSDPYSHSKLAAEQGLQEIGRASGMEWVIIRPPLVYGPGVGGNFATMMRWLRKPVPLPFGAIHNKRSLVARDNLVDLIASCIDHPAAANRVLLVSDGEDLSTTELLKRLAAAMGLRPWLLPIPAGVLMGLGAALGRRQVFERLCQNLQVDIEDTRQGLGWQAPVGVDRGLQLAAAGLRK